LVDAVDGNDDSDWKDRAAKTLQRTPYEPRELSKTPSFKAMQQWKDPDAVLQYLIEADWALNDPEHGKWPEK
jgi:hypothetical protein